MKSMPSFLIIAGTAYGRKLSSELCMAGAGVYATVATEYGRELMAPSESGQTPCAGKLTVLSGRLDNEKMRRLLEQITPDAVINAAHPYAEDVTLNIKSACEAENVRYFRLLRDSEDTDAVYVENMENAVEFLNDSPVKGNILSACGGKEIKHLTAVDGYHERVYIRALPTPEFLAECKALGFASKNLICMQGPFSKELNTAMLRSINAAFLLTKDSGSAGGFAEKLEAAAELGVTSVVIGRPVQGEGLLYDELLGVLKKEFDLDLGTNQKPDAPDYPYFPLFISLKGKKAKVFGAGKIAKRRIGVLLRFGCGVFVVADELKFEPGDTVSSEVRKYKEGDCNGADLVVAATNDRIVNRQIAAECARLGIPVSVCDDQSLCTFYFPAVAMRENIVAGITSSGTDHGKAAEITRRIRNEILNAEDDI